VFSFALAVEPKAGKRAASSPLYGREPQGKNAVPKYSWMRTKNQDLN